MGLLALIKTRSNPWLFTVLSLQPGYESLVANFWYILLQQTELQMSAPASEWSEPPSNSFVLPSGDEWHLFWSLFLAPCSSLRSWFSGICICGCLSISQWVWSSQFVCVSCYDSFYLSGHLNFVSVCFMLSKPLWHTLAKPTPRVPYSHSKTEKKKKFNCWKIHLHRSHRDTCLGIGAAFSPGYLQAIFLRIFILEGVSPSRTKGRFV